MPGTVSKLNHISTTFKQTQMDFGHEEHLTKKDRVFFLSWDIKLLLPLALSVKVESDKKSAE